MLFSALLSISDITRYGLHAGSPDLQTSAIDCNKRVLERPDSFSAFRFVFTQLSATPDVRSKCNERLCIVFVGNLYPLRKLECVSPWTTMMENGGNLLLLNHLPL